MLHPHRTFQIDSQLIRVLLFWMLAFSGVSNATDVSAVFEGHCVQCHNATETNGNINLAGLDQLTDLKSRYHIWKKVVEQVSAGTMPPETEKPLSQDEKKQLLTVFQKTFDTSGNPDPGPPLTRQLTRAEYAQTIRDLLRIQFNAADAAGISEELVVEGFANRTGSQVLDQTLLEKYFAAADLSLEYLFTHKDAAAARKVLLAAVPDGQMGNKETVRQVLAPFLKRAFRRPVSPEEVERFAAFADVSLDSGESFETAIQKAMKPVLVSPQFLLRIEQSPAQSARAATVNDHELAVRLSYFLWGTMPDDELTAAADAGALLRPEVLRAQTLRMLKDSRANALTDRFLGVWLQLPSLSKALPNQNHFPSFNQSLKDAMGREIQRFCEHMRTEDRSILEFLNADYTFVNAELAKHYGIANVSGKEFVKVALNPEDHRGGVLGMAGVLTMTSHRDRTKPTARGKWVMEVLFGTPPPPPPANAGNFPPPDKNRPEPTTFREKLAQHASDASCVACHRRIDPLGFALENYDAIGNWRDPKPDSPIDNKGTLPGFGEIVGIDGLRGVLNEKQPQFVRNVSSQTLMYALGRDVSYYDEPTIEQLVAQLKSNDYRFSTLILGVVESFPFQNRRAEPAK